MTVENWKLQVSYKTGSGDMINIRANTADELSVLLEGVGDYAVQIAATQRLLGASYTAAPLGTADTTPSIAPAAFSPTTQAGVVSPTCVHGTRTFRSGVSKTTGKPYAFWSCPLPMGPEQCKPANA
jgi:hypothetical protein